MAVECVVDSDNLEPLGIIRDRQVIVRSMFVSGNHGILVHNTI